MHVITQKKLSQFWAYHKDAENALKTWFKVAEHAHWNSFVDVKARYGSADLLPGNRVVFNIKGNDYRLVVKIQYNIGIVFIRFVGTHKEYDRINAETI